MNRSTICLCLGLLLFPFEPSRVLAQTSPVKFERLGLEHGLAQGTGYCILQDRQGFMWFGTQGGVYKFDGYKLTVYQQDVFDSTSLSGNAVNALYEDHTGALWIGTYAELNRFDRKSERFTRLALPSESRHNIDNYIIYTIYEDRSHVLWVGTNLGLYKLDPRNGRLTRFIHDDNNPHSLSHNVIWRIYEDSYRTLWFGTEGGGLSRLRVEDREAANFTRFVHDPADPYSLSQNIGGAICEDRFGSLWVGTENGLNRFEREQERFIRFQRAEKNSYSLSDNTIMSLYEDRAGILWIVTQGSRIKDRVSSNQHSNKPSLHQSKNQLPATSRCSSSSKTTATCVRTFGKISNPRSKCSRRTTGLQALRERWRSFRI